MSLTQPVYTPMGPTRPQVPMPEETAVPFICRWKTQVAMGPVMAEARVGGIQILGVADDVAHLEHGGPQSLRHQAAPPVLPKERMAKPTIWAQHPATAAPPAKPVRPRAAQMAALEMGKVRATPHDHRDQDAHEEGLQLRGPT